MKISFNWLKDYVEFDLTPKQLAEKLTNAGFEVEEIIETIPKFENIVVGKIISCEKHPDADRLSICDVQLREKSFKVICGAPNVRKGQNIPFAQIGVVLPNGLKIKKAKIRGVESFGMICSEEELGLSDKSDGIWILPNNWALGEDVFELLSDSRDFVFDLAITPNRPDALSMIGIAREVAAFTKGKLKIPSFDLIQGDKKASDFIDIEIENPTGCPRYAAKIINNIEIKPSPKWMSDRLKNAGIRPINNIVDITNYVLIETGQPLHAFDYDLIENSKIIVRFSKKNEKFITLDEKERKLPQSTVLICDGKRPVAIGGIMGGLNSEVTEHTKNILLESAYFNPVNIGHSSRRLGLSTEASQRFERGMDPNGVIYAANRASQLMCELAGGKLSSGTVDNYPEQIKPKKFIARVDRINKVLGTSLSKSEVNGILRSLNIEFSNDEVTIPTFRPDLSRESDIVEEIARSITFEKIPLKEKTSIYYENKSNEKDVFLFNLKNQFVELEMNEVLTNSMIARSLISNIENENPIMPIYNPISDDMNIMRPSLFPGLLKSVAYNINRNQTNLRLFELGRVFKKLNDKFESDQSYYLSGVITGNQNLPSWSNTKTNVDFYDLKGIVETFLNKIFLDNAEIILYDRHYYLDEKNTLSIKLGKRDIGCFGKVKNNLLQRFDISQDVFGFEFHVDNIYEIRSKNRTYESISKFPYIEKDLAFTFDWNENSNEIKNAIAKIGGSLVNDVNIFDVYIGDNIGKNKKSIAFRIKFQSFEKTLQDDEVNILFQKIIKKIEANYDAKLRE